MQSKRFDGNAVLAILGILREQNRFRPDKIVVVNGLEPGGEVLGETIAQPGSLNTLIQQKGCHGGLATRGKLRVNYGLSRRALNSAVECHLHTVEVAGSNPAAPTINIAESMIYGAGIGAFIGAIWDPS
jgi:hypothetical protein